MKRSFFQAAVTSILLYGCTTWTLTKRLEKKLDGNYTRMLRAILNKSWRQHPTRHQLYGHLSPITQTIQVRRTRHAGHCWRSRDELIRDVLLWTPTHGRAKGGRPARTYIQQLCEDTGCCPENLPRAMNDREWKLAQIWNHLNGIYIHPNFWYSNTSVRLSADIRPGLCKFGAWLTKPLKMSKKSQRDFSDIFETASNFVVHANCKLEEVNISVPKSFSISTIRSSRSAPDSIIDEKRNFEVSYHNAVTDAVLSSMRARFSSHEKLYKQISCFDPNRFSEILASLQNVELSLIAKAVSEIDRVAQQDELISLASSYEDLKKGLLENMNDNEND